MTETSHANVNHSDRFRNNIHNSLENARFRVLVGGIVQFSSACDLGENGCGCDEGRSVPNSVGCILFSLSQRFTVNISNLKN